MSFASGGYHGLYYCAEVAFGVTPNNPVWKPFRHTSCSLQLKRDKFDSKELRADRAMVDVRLGTYKCEGDVHFELSYSSFDDILEALLAGTWTLNVLQQGVVQRSFSILRRFSDIGQYECFAGCCPNKLVLDVKPNGMTTGVFSFIGVNMTPSLPAGSSYSAANSNPPMDSFSSSIYEGGVACSIASALQITLNNGIEADVVIGSKFAPQVTWGRALATGKLTAFFQDLTTFNKFINEQASSLQFTTAAGGQSYTWLMNNVKYTSGDNPVTDEKPVHIDMNFDALHDGTYTCLQISRAPGSASPSASPSKSPSSSPSGSPSSSPSKSPSASPSASPST